MYCIGEDTDYLTPELDHFQRQMNLLLQVIFTPAIKSLQQEEI